jgi:hypothetical protein
LKTPSPTIAEQAAAAQAEANRLRAEAERIDAAGAQARIEAAIQHYHHAATDVAYEYRQQRDTLQTKLTEMAVAEDGLNALFKAWVEMRDADAKAGALNVHCSMLDTLQPPQRQWNGAYPMPSRAAVDELYTPRNGWTFSAFVDRVLAQRADRIRAHHVEELRAQSHKEVSAAEQQARDAAAAGG